MSQPRLVEPDVGVVVIVRGDERYLVVLHADDADQQCEALRLFGRWASNPALSFTWYDAAEASRKVRLGEYDAWPA